MKIDSYPKIQIEYMNSEGNILTDEWQEHEYGWALTTFNGEIAFNLVRSMRLYYWWSENEWVVLKEWNRGQI